MICTVSLYGLHIFPVSLLDASSITMVLIFVPLIISKVSSVLSQLIKAAKWLVLIYAKCWYSHSDPEIHAVINP